MRRVELAEGARAPEVDGATVLGDRSAEGTGFDVLHGDVADVLDENGGDGCLVLRRHSQLAF